MGCKLSRPQHKRAKRYEVSSEQVKQPQGQPAKGVAVQASSVCSQASTSTQHAPQEASSGHVPSHKPTSVAAPPPQKAKLDPKDFMFYGLQSETQVKLLGSVNGQQFIIDNCMDCDLFVLDHCASVTIDDCTNCRIFIGPTEASVFMRDCSNCTLATITRQLRCRDCKDCSLLLLCRTRPVIESSSGMAFGCYDAPYAGLAAQMAAAKLSPFHNSWSDVFDFTPAGAAADAGSGAGAAKTGSAQQQQQQQSNWRLLPHTASVQQLLGNPALPVQVCRLVGVANAAPATGSACVNSAALADVAQGPRGAGASAESTGEQQPGSRTPTAVAAGGVAEGAAAVAAASSTAGAVTSTSLAAEQEAVSVVSEADRMCVIHTSRRTLQSSNHCLFALFPAGKQDAALQWVYSSITQQQQQQQQPSQVDQQQQQQAEQSCLAAADPAEISVGFSTDPAAGASTGAVAAPAVVVLHTNEASIPGPVLQQMATAAGWSKQQLKQLGTAAALTAKGKGSSGSSAAMCAGLEVVCCDEGTKQQLCTSAEAAGALCCTSTAAAQLFRDLGVDG